MSKYITRTVTTEFLLQCRHYVPLHLMYVPIQRCQRKHWFILPPKKQAADSLISVDCLCLICIIHFLLSKLFIYLDRKGSGQESMTASWYVKSHSWPFSIQTVHSQKGTTLDTADILNSIGSPQFLVSQRSVCERFTKLEKSFTKK